MTQQLLERASILFEQKRYKEAQNNIMEVLAVEPENIHCLIMLSEINIANGDYNKALELINQAIGIEPDFEVLFYVKSKILLFQEKLKEAETCIDEAIALNPFDSNSHALKANILLEKRNFDAALNSANKALEIDASNIFALNVRSTVLTKLNKSEESFKTIESALRDDPNNAYTHANYGWNLLEKGNKDKALEHFKESLKNDPNNAYAQSGMSEALKSKYLVYRWFLNYSFWMQNLTSKNQWIFILGFYFAQKILTAVAKQVSPLEPFVLPIVVAMAIFAFSTWVISPLANLLFRLNRYGKHLLTPEEKKSASYVGVSLFVFMTGLALLIFIEKEICFSLMLVGFTMMLPLGRFYDKPSIFFKAYNFGLIALAILSIVTTTVSLNFLNGFTQIYFVGFIAFQWVANYFRTKN